MKKKKIPSGEHQAKPSLNSPRAGYVQVPTSQNPETLLNSQVPKRTLRKNITSETKFHWMELRLNATEEKISEFEDLPALQIPNKAWKEENANRASKSQKCEQHQVVKHT